MKKNICHIITRFLNGGAEENTLITCNYSVKIGDKVTLIIGSEYENQIISKLDKRVKLIKIKNLVRDINPLKDLLAFYQLFCIIKKLNPDIIHTHESKAGILGRLSAKLNKVPVIIHTVHILPFINVNFFKKSFYILLEQITSLVTDKYICVSKGMLDQSLKHNISHKKKYCVIHSGFNINKFKNVKLNYNLVKLKNYKKYYNMNIITYVGAFEKRKRQIEFLSIFKKLLIQNKKLFLIFVGSGMLLKKVKKEAKRLKIKNNILFTGYTQYPERYIALSNLCVMYSIREGLPRVIPQYFASGKPVVSTDIPGVEEIIINSKNGFIIRHNSEIDFFNKINFLLKKNKNLLKMTKFAKQTDVTKWSDKKMPNKIDFVYRKLLKRYGQN